MPSFDHDNKVGLFFARHVAGYEMNERFMGAVQIQVIHRITLVPSKMLQCLEADQEFSLPVINR